jgi:hypothetical protein
MVGGDGEVDDVVEWLRGIVPDLSMNMRESAFGGREKRRRWTGCITINKNGDEYEYGEDGFGLVECTYSTALAASLAVTLAFRASSLTSS